MKVVGTGSPMMLTVRVKSCEVGVLRDVLCRRRSEAVAAAGMEREARSVGDDDDGDVEARHDEMFVIAKVLDDLRRPVAPGQPRELAGPTWLLDPVIRDAASEATGRLGEAVEVFLADRGRLTADELRAAVDAAAACAASLIGLDYVQNHAVV